MNHAKPDELVEIAEITGPATIISDDTGEEIPVLCNIRLYQHMLWCGDGFPRSKGGRSIEGRVWKGGEMFWARQNVGKRFLLVSGERRVNFFIINENGKIGNIGDSNWAV